VQENIDAWQEEMTAIGKPKNHPMLSPEWQDFTLAEALGLQLIANGQLVGGVAARFHDLGQETLGEYWARSYRRMYGQGQSVPVHTPARRAAYDVKGRVVYLGELFINKDFRGDGISALVMHYLFLLCAVRWRDG